MLLMQIRFVIEFLLCVDGFCSDFGTGKFPNITVQLIVGISWIVVTEILSVVALIYCMWIAS